MLQTGARETLFDLCKNYTCVQTISNIHTAGIYICSKTVVLRHLKQCSIVQTRATLDFRLSSFKIFGGQILLNLVSASLPEAMSVFTLFTIMRTMSLLSARSRDVAKYLQFVSSLRSHRLTLVNGSTKDQCRPGPRPSCFLAEFGSGT